VIKGILKLALLAAVANAMWHVFVPYRSHLRFTDALHAVALADVEQSDDEQRARVLALANRFDIPLTADSFTLSREPTHTVSDGSYTKPIELFPTVWYPWTFTWHIDTLHFAPTRVDDSGHPR
jgi:hypothetical protein